MKAQAMSFAPPKGTAGLYLLRPGNFVGSAGVWPLNLDGKSTGALANGTFIYITVHPGDHVVGPKGSTFDAEAGKNYYFKAALGFSAPHIRPISDSEGQELAKSLKLSGDSWIEYQGPSGQPKSTIMLKVELPINVNRPPNTLLKVLNLDTKSMMNDWVVRADGWVVQEVPVGRYLILSLVASAGNPFFIGGERSISKDLHCDLVVPKSNATIYYGTITFPTGGSFHIETGIPDILRTKYQQTELLEGEMKPETVR